MKPMRMKPVFKGRLLQSAREEARHSQASLATAVGVSRGAIAQYEGGESVPGSNILAAIAVELEKAQEYFFGLPDQNPDQATAEAS